MAALSQQESRKRYSWWWDSHISPKNSKWLQENLTGMDSKVKQMIKLIEEDADSFARRAEMYYKRRPELMRLVEEFYRAYRALAERYDHATGVIRHAHKTMVEAFPDQDLMSDDLGEFFDPDEMQKDALGLSSPDIQVPKRKGLKQIDFFEKGTARKSLNFNEAREKERNLNNGSNHNAKSVGFNDSKHSMSKHDEDVSLLKEALVKLEAEKEVGLLNYQSSLERLSNLEKEFRLAQEDSDKLTARAIKAEAEVELLNGALIELKAEKELVSLQYQQCLNKIFILEKQIFCFEQDAKETSDRAYKAESEVLLLKQDLAMLKAEKEAVAAQHKQCTETVTGVETKLQQAEESVKRTNERAKVAESKVEALNLDLIKLTEEKNAYSVQCQQYLEKISTLEFQILFSQEEAQRLNEEISNGVIKLKDVENQCLSIATSHQSLQSDLDSLIRKMESKNKELTEKQIELNRLWTYVQEERLRFVEAETAFQTLQHLHNESQEELTALASELQNRAQTVLDLKENNHCLQEEVLKIKEENRTLNEVNLSSAVSMENMEDEISSLRATIVKLHEEIQIWVSERNILQKEIHSLREEFNEAKLKHGALLDQMESLELDPESFVPSVRKLRDDSSKLNDAYQREKTEKVSLLEKLEIMARLVDKNELLEISIADLNSELQQVKEKMKTLEETCHLLVEERSAIVTEKNALHSQIQVLTENSGALLVKNVSLENSLADANAELDAMKEKSRRLENSLLLIGIEKTELLNESEILSSQLNVTKHRLEDIENKHEKLEVKILDLETEKQFLICSLSEMCDSLKSSKKENSDTAKFYQTQLASLECQLHLLQEEAQLSKNMYNEELDTAIKAKIEISILHGFLLALHGNNTYLGRQCLELFEASQASEKNISDLEHKYADQQAESKALFDVLEKLEVKNFDLETERQFLICRIGEMRDSLNSAKKENSDTVKFYQTQLASLECQLHLLQEEAQLSNNSYNKEKDTTGRTTIEISILHSFLRELHGNNTYLGRQCLELFEASQTSEKLILDLEQKYADQQAESKALLEVLEKLRAGFYQMSKTLGFDKGITPRHMYEDIPFSNLPHSNHILETADEFKKALATTLNENHQLLLEKAVLITLLQQLQVEAVDIDMEKCILSQNLKASAKRLLQLLTEVHDLSEKNELLKKNVEERDYREKHLRSDMEELSLNLLDVERSYQTLQQANNLVLEEKKSLIIEISNLKGAKFALEEEIHEVLVDAVSLSNIFLVFQDFYSEKSMEVNKLDGSMCQLHHVKDTLEEVIKQLEKKLQIMLEDKSRLVESLKASDNELKTLRSINCQLNHEVSNDKELLSQREIDLSEAKLKHEILLNEQAKLQSLIKELKGHYENEKAAKEEKAEQIFKLVKENGMRNEEYDDLCSSKHSIETELLELIKKHECVIAREELYQKEYEELLKEQQVSGILEACYYESFQELSKKFDSNVNTVSSMDSEARLLKERLTVLEVENAELRAHFKEYNSAVKSLSDSVACLESQAISHDKLLKTNVTKEAGTKQVPVQVDTSNAATGCSELKNLQSRIQAVELAVSDIQKVASEGSLGSSVGAQRSLVHKDNLVSGRSFRKERVELRRQRHHNSSASSELSELPKDIVLDQVSDCSSYGQRSRREITAADNHMLESWVTINKDSSLDFSDAKVQNTSYGKKTSSSEITAEKEVTVVDKLEIPKSSKDPQETGKKVKILERLHFDAQKLASLQKTVHDLKSKVGIAEKSKRTKGVIEYDTVKEQLEEAEEAIEKLFGVNEKLIRTVEDDSLSSKSENGLDESGTVRKRRVLEQIRRSSEKISRLHFEVQKLQFMLVKLEGEKDTEVKTRVIPRSPRVRLRDYLYGSSRQVFAHKHKRRQFCGCVRPSTKGD